jgi:hypothetical protein
MVFKGGPWREVLGQTELLQDGGVSLVLNVSQSAVLMKVGAESV